jgi:hypothetical protein
MDTNEREPKAEGAKLLLKDEAYQLVGCAMEVLNGIGHGLPRVTTLRVGVLLNFKHAKLEWERIVL